MFTSSRNQENANKNHNELWSPTVRPVAGSQRGQRWWQWGENLRRHLKIDHVGLGGKWKKGGSHKLFLDFPERAMRPWTEIRKLKQGRPRGLDARRRWRTVGRNCWYGVKSAETGLPPPLVPTTSSRFHHQAVLHHSKTASGWRGRPVKKKVGVSQ